MVEKWYNKKIILINDRINEKGELFTYNDFCHVYNIKTNFLEYNVIKTVIKKCISEYISSDKVFTLVMLFAPNHLKSFVKNFKGCQVFYKIFNINNYVPKGQEKWNYIFESKDLNWKTIYRMQFELLISIKML